MAKPPCARLTKPMRPIVTDRPTDTMKSTMPAATPPRSMLATSTPQITSALGRGRRSQSGRGSARSLGARPDLLLLAGVLDAVDRADHLLRDLAVLHHDFGEVLVHHDIARDGVDRDGPAWTVELPSLERIQCLVRLDLALEHVDHVDDRGHAVVATHGHEVRRGVRAVLLLPRGHEALVLGIV